MFFLCTCKFDRGSACVQGELHLAGQGIASAAAGWRMWSAGDAKGDNTNWAAGGAGTAA